MSTEIIVQKENPIKFSELAVGAWFKDEQGDIGIKIRIDEDRPENAVIFTKKGERAFIYQHADFALVEPFKSAKLILE
jgi:hypothetical protein